MAGESRPVLSSSILPRLLQPQYLGYAPPGGLIRARWLAAARLSLPQRDLECCSDLFSATVAAELAEDLNRCCIAVNAEPMPDRPKEYAGRRDGDFNHRHRTDVTPLPSGSQYG